MQPIDELNKCSTWEEKVEVFTQYFSNKFKDLTVENQKLICMTIYDHILSLEDYDISLLSRIKSSITLLKPTFMTVTLIEEDYGLHKVNLTKTHNILSFLKYFL